MRKTQRLQEAVKIAKQDQAVAKIIKNGRMVLRRRLFKVDVLHAQVASEGTLMKMNRIFGERIVM
jgi:hypothetical protein